MNESKETTIDNLDHIDHQLGRVEMDFANATCGRCRLDTNDCICCEKCFEDNEDNEELITCICKEKWYE